MQFTHLSQRGLLAISGEDTIPFLQGILSNDMRGLEQGKPVYALLLTPQGKFLHDLFLISWNGKIWIDCERARADDLRKRLTLYKLRSKVTIEAAPEQVGVFAAWDGTWNGASDDFISYADLRLPQLGARLIGSLAAIDEQLKTAKAEQGDYDRLRLSLGVPDGSRDLIIEKSLPLDWGIDALHGIDFTKGCYVGQEVTARMRYRAQSKKSIYQVTSESGTLPEVASPICVGDSEIGELRSSHENKGLAILRIEEVEKSRASGAQMKSGEIILQATRPTWLEKAISATQTISNGVE